jgi:hypothetical protein
MYFNYAIIRPLFILSIYLVQVPFFRNQLGYNPMNKKEEFAMYGLFLFISTGLITTSLVLGESFILVIGLFVWMGLGALLALVLKLLNQY